LNDWNPVPWPAGEPMLIEVQFVSTDKVVTGSLWIEIAAPPACPGSPPPSHAAG